MNGLVGVCKKGILKEPRHCKESKCLLLNNAGTHLGRDTQLKEPNF